MKVSYKFLPIESPKIPIGNTGISVSFTGKLGELSGAASINGTYDPSLAFPGYIEGELSASMGNMGLAIKATWGPKYCNVYAEADATINEIKLNGNVKYLNNKLVLTPSLEVNPIVFSLNVGLDLVGVECEMRLLEYSLPIPEVPEFNSITLFQVNN